MNTALLQRVKRKILKEPKQFLMEMYFSQIAAARIDHFIATKGLE